MSPVLATGFSESLLNDFSSLDKPTFEHLHAFRAHLLGLVLLQLHLVGQSLSLQNGGQLVCFLLLFVTQYFFLFVCLELAHLPSLVVDGLLDDFVLSLLVTRQRLFRVARRHQCGHLLLVLPLLLALLVEHLRVGAHVVLAGLSQLIQALELQLTFLLLLVGCTRNLVELRVFVSVLLLVRFFGDGVALQQTLVDLRLDLAGCTMVLLDQSILFEVEYNLL